MSFAAFPTKPITPNRATEFRLPPQSAKREHRSARVYSPRSPVITRPETARTHERPAPILELPGLPPSPVILPDEVSKPDSPKQGGAASLFKSGKTWLAQFKPPWVKDPLRVKIPPTPKTASWADEEGQSYTPKYTPTTATFKAFGLPKDFGKKQGTHNDFASVVTKIMSPKSAHIRRGSDEGEEWNRDPPPLYTKHASEGGIPAWSTLAAGFLVQFCTFGYVFTWNVFEDHYTHHHLTDQSPLAIRFVGSIQWFLVFFLALVGGKLADMGYYQYVVHGGSLLFVISVFLLSAAGEEAFALVLIFQGLLMGIAIGLVFVPTAVVATRYFRRLRGMAIGIVMSGASLGGMIFPVALRALIPKMGFGNAVRVTGVLAFIFLAAANAQIFWFPLPPEEEPRYPVPHLDIAKYSKETEYICMAGITFLAMLFIFYPVWYLEVLGLVQGVNSGAAFSSVIILSFFGIVGRVGLGFASDKGGIWNTLLATTMLLAIMMFGVCTISAAGTLIAVSMFYGIFMSAWLSLTVTALASFASRNTEIGTRVGLIFSLASFGQLFSDLIQYATLGGKFNWAVPSAIAGIAFLIITGVTGFLWTKFASKVPLSRRKYFKVEGHKILQLI
jgi:MCP family monocarboxylic acid transporter-like MFS transporter 10